MNKNRTIIAAVIILAVLIGGGLMMNHQVKLQNENEQLTVQVDSLLEQKAALLVEMESLQLAFEDEHSRADSLSTILTEVQTQVAQRNAAAIKIKNQHTTEVGALKKEIEELRKLRIEAEGYVNQLRDENAALLAQNTELTQTLGEVQNANETLTAKGQALLVSNDQLQTNNSSLKESVAKLKAASVKASGFQITTDKKSGKSTLNAKKVKAINISFDMNAVPAEHQGNQTLYLVVTDEMGVPAKVDNPVRVRITTDGQIMEIESQQSKEVKLVANQRIDFEQQFDSKLKAGKYKATIYSKVGMLGSSNFVLN
jgi:hypothetical protein